MSLLRHSSRVQNKTSEECKSSRHKKKKKKKKTNWTNWLKHVVLLREGDVTGKHNSHCSAVLSLLNHRSEIMVSR